MLRNILTELFRRNNKTTNAAGQQITDLLHQASQYIKNNRFDEASRLLAQVTETNPDNGKANQLIARMHWKQGELEHANTYFSKAVENSDSNQFLHVEYGDLLRALNEQDAALAQYEAAQKLQPDNALAHYRASQIFLSHGDFEKGWNEFQWRKRLTCSHGIPIREYYYPDWDGRALEDETILLYPEGTVDDGIIFSTCVHDVIKSAQHVVIECPPQLFDAYRRTFPAATVHAVNDKGDRSWLWQAPAVTCQASIADIPLYLRKSAEEFPVQGKYLAPKMESVHQWREKVCKESATRYVGVILEMNKENQKSNTIQDTLDALREVLQLDEVHLVFLDNIPDSDVLSAFKQYSGASLFDSMCTPEKNLDEYAALLSIFDIVITNNAGTANISGGFGVPTLYINSGARNWRWFPRDGRSIWFHDLQVLSNCENCQSTNIVRSVKDTLAFHAKHTELPHNDALIHDADTHSYSNIREVDLKILSKVALMNDTIAWYHWGCTCTSTALHQHITNGGHLVFSIPILDIYSCEYLPTNMDDFDDVAFYERFCLVNKNVIDQMKQADTIIINGEGTIHHLTKPALALLYLAYIAKTYMSKQVQIINHSSYPGIQQGWTEEVVGNIYRKVYQSVDYVAVREDISAAILDDMGINITRSFDCLPLYLEDNYKLSKTRDDHYVVVAGSVSWSQAGLSCIVAYMKWLFEQGLRTKVLIGAKANIAFDDIKFVENLKKTGVFGWEVVNAFTMDEWLSTLENASLLVSGRFHHSIAAAYLKTPFITLDSNTSKNDALMDLFGLSRPIAFDDPSLLDKLKELTLSRTANQPLVSDEILSKLRRRSRENFYH